MCIKIGPEFHSLEEEDLEGTWKKQLKMRGLQVIKISLKVYNDRNALT